jgi:hypothetical protein
MRFIGIKAHSYLDYIAAVLLIAAPWIFGFNDNDRATLVPVILGVATILYSLNTNYGLSINRKISVRKHLLLDFMNGLILTMSPWIFHFYNDVWLPHVIIGIFELAVVLFTKSPDRAGEIIEATTAL